MAACVALLLGAIKYTNKKEGMSNASYNKKKRSKSLTEANNTTANTKK